MMKTITELTIPKKEEKLIRLAPYIRVSSNSDDQLLSFAAQLRAEYHRTADCGTNVKGNRCQRLLRRTGHRNGNP